MLNGRAHSAGYIQYRDSETVKIAVEGMHGRTLDGRDVKVDWARPSREFDPTATRQPYTPPNRSAAAGSSSAGASSWNSGAAASAPLTLPLGAITEVYNPAISNLNRKVEIRDNKLIITRSFEVTPAPRSGLFAHIRS